MKAEKLICYILLGIVLIVTIAFMGKICVNEKKQEEESVIRLEKAREDMEEQLNILAQNERIVLVKTLPIYATDNISINKEAEPKTELCEGETVLLEEEGSPYSLVKTMDGIISGYVWNDCLGEVTEKNKIGSEVIVIDAGHQGEGNNEQKPIGPGAEDTRIKVASGATGVSTKIKEHETVLEIALALETELEARGYIVVQVRRDADIDISNSERAVLANQIEADVLIRLHGNGANSSSVSGAEAYYISKNNPYVDADIYNECKSFAESVLDAYAKANPEIGKRTMYENDTYTGLNWCEVPSCILEMGYLSNENDDEYLNAEENQTSIVCGIANGIDVYFSKSYVE